MYCRNCGHQLDDRAVFCPHCGVATDNEYIPQQQYAQVKPNRGLVTAAKVFIILGIIFSACNIVSTAIDIMEELINIANGYSYGNLLLYIIELAVNIIWIIPGSIFGAVALKKIPVKKPSAAVCVCVLIFTSLIGGILLLCTKDNDYMQN